MSKTIIFIIGMGRSGTSAMSRVLSLCGGTLPEQLVEAHESNPKGHWEPLEAMQLNDSFLHEHGSSWFDPSPILSTHLDISEPDHADFIVKIHRLLRSWPTENFLIVKEPRITALAPLWFEAARREGFTIKVVIPVRDPSEIAMSLTARNGLAREHSDLLTLKYYLLAERFSRGYPRIFVDYEKLLLNWRHEVDRISQTLELDLPQIENAEIDEFLTPDLHRQRRSSDAVQESGLTALAEVSKAFNAAASDEVIDTEGLNKIAMDYFSYACVWPVATEKFLTHYKMFDISKTQASINEQAAARSRDLVEALETAEPYARHLENELDKSKHAFDELAEEDKALRMEMEKAAHYVRHLEEEIDKAKQANSELIRLNDSQKAEIEEAVKHALSLEAELASRGLHLDELAERDKALKMEVEKAVHYVRHLEEELDKAKQANSELIRLNDSQKAEIEKKTVQHALSLEAELASRRLHFDEAEKTISAAQIYSGVLEDRLGEAGRYARGLEAELASRSRQLEEARKPALPSAQFLDLELSKLKSELDEAYLDLSAARNLVHVLRLGISGRDHALNAVNFVSKRYKQENDLIVKQITDLASYNEQLHAEIFRLRSLSDISLKVTQLELLLIEKSRQIDAVTADLNAILGSSSWQLTRPVRNLFGNSPKARRTLRRATKLAWWTASLQLSRRLALRAEMAALAMSAEKSEHLPDALIPTELDFPPSSPGLPDIFLPLPEAPKVLDQKAIFTLVAREELLEFLSSEERLSFTKNSCSDISIIIVLWNQAHLTLRCLLALISETGPSFEIILFDNASTDETAKLLSRLDGVRIISNSVNDGFLLGCNEGAKFATGRNILLLNSDAFVRPGALTAALSTLESNATIGAVGGRLILPSGLLQEAGSIIWSDASTLGYGRGLSPIAGEAMFRRDVDYCSGAFLLTRRSLWNSLGGFDESYAPAYYEETDYCMRVRESGFRIVYEPAAVIDHYEFGSEKKNGDSNSASLHNRKILRRRHGVELRRDYLPYSPSNILAARKRILPGQRHLLVIDNEVPLGILGSGYPRAREILCETFAAGWSVTFFPLHQLEFDWETARREIPWEVELMYGWGLPRLAEFLEERRGQYDAVIVSRPDNMALVRSVLSGRQHVLHGTRLIYDAEALFSSRDILKAKLDNRPLSKAESETRISIEVGLAADVDAVICVNEMEGNIYRDRQQAPVYVLSHPTEVKKATSAFNDRNGFLFVGRLLERETPNWLGLAWFVKHCWPLIQDALPDAVLTVAGHLHPEHEDLNSQGICLLGPVDDLASLYASARVFVAPVHFAAGVPIKILEATASGLPTVGTHLMARQLDWNSEIEILAQDQAASFATAATMLHEDPILWETIRANSIARIEQQHSRALFKACLEAALLGSEVVREDHGKS